MLTRSKQYGFTLVELLVITPIVILAVMGTVALLINLIAENAVTNAENAASAEVQSVLSEIQNSLSSSDVFLYNPSITDTSRNNYYPTGTPSSSAPFNSMYIIGKTYDQIVINSKIEPGFLTTPNSCNSANRAGNDVRPTNTIYFAQKTADSKTDLKRRILASTSPSICGAGGASVATGVFPPSCEATSTTPPCNGDDILVKDVVKFQPTYYNSSGGQITPSSDASLVNATAAKIELVVRKSVGGKDVRYKGEVRFDLLNK